MDSELCHGAPACVRIVTCTLAPPASDLAFVAVVAVFLAPPEALPGMSIRKVSELLALLSCSSHVVNRMETKNTRKTPIALRLLISVHRHCHRSESGCSRKNIRRRQVVRVRAQGPPAFVRARPPQKIARDPAAGGVLCNNLF